MAKRRIKAKAKVPRLAPDRRPIMAMWQEFLVEVVDRSGFNPEFSAVLKPAFYSGARAMFFHLVEAQDDEWRRQNKATIEAVLRELEAVLADPAKFINDVLPASGTRLLATKH
jgi:hypothetical protein